MFVSCLHKRYEVGGRLRKVSSMQETELERKLDRMKGSR